MTRKYILYDGRACDEATVLEVCDDETEAREASRHYEMAAVYSYAVDADGKTLIDEQHEWNVLP